MSIAIVQRGGDAQLGVTSCTVTFSSAPTPGQLMLVVLRRDGASGIIPPSGWDTHAGPLDGSLDTYVFEKIAGVGEPTVHVFGLSAPTNVSHRFFVIDGFNDPVDTDTLRVSATYSAGTDMPDPPAVAIPSLPTEEFAAIAVGVWNFTGATLTSYPAGYVNGGNHIANGASMASAEFVGVPLAINTTVDPGPFTISASRPSLGVTIVILQNASGPPPSDNLGTAEIVEGIDTLSNNVDLILDAAVDIVEGIDTLSSTVSLELTSSVEIVEGVDSLSSTSSAEVTGTLEAVEGADSLSSTVSLAVTGAVDIVEGADSLTATVSSVSSGTVDMTEGSDSLTATSSSVNSGAVNLFEGEDSLSSTVTSVNSGAIDLVEGEDSLFSSTSSTNAGSVDTIEGEDLLSSSVSSTNGGTVDLIEGEDSLSSVVATTNNGAVDVIEGEDDLAASDGTVLSGSLDVIEGEDSLSSSSSSTVAGVVDLIEGEDSLLTVTGGVVSGGLDLIEGIDTALTCDGQSLFLHNGALLVVGGQLVNCRGCCC